MGSLFACAGSQSQPKTGLELQREMFVVAIEDARNDRLPEARHLRESLQDYVLLPYLDLELFKATMYDMTPEQANNEINRYKGTAVGSLMKQAWRAKLARNKEWDAFLATIRGNAPRGLRCDFIRALRATGEDVRADTETQSLWLTGYSLPDSCDRVLSVWLSRLSVEQIEQMHQRRAELAIQNGQSGLALYLLRRVKGTETARELLRQPERLHQLGDSLEVTPFNRELVMLSLKRLASRDYEATNPLWHQLARRFQFTQKENHRLRDTFARQIIAGGAPFARDWLNANDPNFEDHYLTEWRVRLALKDRDWKAAQHFIKALPSDIRNEAEWQYWWARADIEIQQTMTDETKASLKQLAQERGYYSFMAADMLGLDYQLGAKRTVNRDLMPAIQAMPAAQRARELYWHGLVRNADAEWRRAVRKLNREEQVAASQVALEWGWPHAAVMTAIRAKEWDDLELRFPMAFAKTFETNARDRNIDLNWAYSIARQESAFAEHAQSRVGARGVMQLMPGTAQTIARELGKPSPKVQDLHNPTVNIEMGSYYLGRLLKDFGGNHILATAAYNAGPERIRRVLARQKEPMPADIWIENLPYGETREYIKNVLAFSVVYGLKLKDCKSPSVQAGCNAKGKERYAYINPLPTSKPDRGGDS
ncbi:soluble lytic murein transglycosylase [Litorivivens lipolytica]|uniref:Soluble lytic murein transglycosylase n=1 Tax=Litorivivens lipolytica TaxID=1524264 RepID=A0A7W4Z5E0_9GAMM|nr:transglycosylase SLT domain-containing protein [Litorivivens lipolytica]MBB3045841.1 soluble lytic murein transglycosylase [Litorivivens lipolytica]